MPNYIRKKETLDIFQKNFSYSYIPPSSGGIGEFTIKYIGKIGEGAQADSSGMKRDYLSLLSGSVIPKIPQLFTLVPRESMVLYIKHPDELLTLLDEQEFTTTLTTGIDPSETVKKFIRSFFALQDLSNLQKNLKEEMIIAINNLDITSPDVVIIVPESAKDHFSPTGESFSVASKDGYIFFARSESSLERFLSLPQSASMAESPDFQYVWTKKSSRIQDAFVFVGDAFFEKMITFESYIAHYRKIRDTTELNALQETVWAYEDAF